MFVDCLFVELSSCSEDDILKELEELSLEAQGGKAKVSTTSGTHPAEPLILPR